MKCVLGNKEALGVHLNLCEVYQCTKCQRKETNFGDIKQHIMERFLYSILTFSFVMYMFFMGTVP